MADAAPRHGLSNLSRLGAIVIIIVIFIAIVLGIFRATTKASVTASPVASASPRPSVAVIPGRTLYMSAFGSDVADGLTTKTPFRTLRYWKGTLKPGDTVLVRGGTYITQNGSSEYWRPSINGTPSGPITIKAYPGETPVFDGQGTVPQFVVLDGSSYLTFDGLTVQNFRPVGNGVFIMADGSHDIVVRNVTANGNIGSSQDTDQFLYVASGSHDIFIDSVSVTGTTAAAVMIGGGTAVSNVTVSDSHLYGNGRGITDGDITVGTRITGNVIENNSIAQIHFHSNGTGHGSTDASLSGNALRGSVGLWVEGLDVSPITESNDCIESPVPFVTGYPLSSGDVYTLAQWQATGRGAGTIVGACP